MLDASSLWLRLSEYARSWSIPPPRLSASWSDLPPALAALARDGWIERPMLEPPASDADLQVLQRGTGLVVPPDVRALYAIHDGSFAPLLPHGMSLLPYAAMLTTWRAFARLATVFSGGIVEAGTDGLHVTVPYHRLRLPIAAADDVALLVDLGSGPSGTEGRVLLQVDDGRHVEVGSSTGTFLSRWLQLLDAGRVRFSQDCGYAVPVHDEQVEDLLRT